MNELIRKQDAIDAVNKYYNDHKYIKRSRTTLTAICTDMKNMIERLPSAEPCDNCIHDDEDWDSEACDGCVATDRANRVFVAIVVEYPKVSTYKEYEGKPYFSIKYIEDGQKYIGYGTYSPKVLSEYLRKYFMPPTESEEFEWCHDCKEYDQEAHCCHRWTKVIRNTVEELKAERTDVSEILQYLDEELHPIVSPDHWNVYSELYYMISTLSTERKGKWIHKPNIYGVVYCSECDFELHINDTNYCPNCGADMRGEQDE